MKKYTNGIEIRYFDNDAIVGDWIDLSKYRLMTESEILKHESNPNTDYHAWNGTEWIDIRTEEEKLAYKRSQYPKLTRYQFMRGLLHIGFKSSDIEAQIMRIEDEFIRELTMLGFKDAGDFERNDLSVGVMRDMLNKTDLEIDEFWEQCLLFQCKLNANI